MNEPTGALSLYKISRGLLQPNAQSLVGLGPNRHLRLGVPPPEPLRLELALGALPRLLALGVGSPQLTRGVGQARLLDRVRVSVRVGGQTRLLAHKQSHSAR